MATHILETRYQGTTLRLEFEDTPDARLMINGLTRKKRRATCEGSTILRLASTVQTDYEWHEFIEAIVDYGEKNIQATLVANNMEIARDSFER